MDINGIVTFERFIRLEGWVYIIGKGHFSETLYLHADGQWRNMATINTPEGRKFSGRFSSEKEAKRVLDKSMGGGFGQMAQAFEKVHKIK